MPAPSPQAARLNLDTGKMDETQRRAPIPVHPRRAFLLDPFPSLGN